MLSQMRRMWSSYSWPVLRWSAIFIVLPDLVEVVLVELTDEAGKVAVLEVFREDGLGKLFVL